jgi:hypothetical protein
MSKVKENLYELIGILSIAAILIGVPWNIAGFFGGVRDAPGRHDREIKGCDYTSFAQYTPSYALACELFRYRGPKEGKE